MKRFILVCITLLVLPTAPADAQSSGVAPEGAFKLPLEHLQPLIPHRHFTPIPGEKKGFSHWGYRHNELHAGGFIDQLMAATGSNCCNGPMSGECRVSEVDLPHRLVRIDDKWCPIRSKTKIATIEGLSNLNEQNKVVAMVCAGINLTDFDGCPEIYCVGVASRQ